VSSHTYSTELQPDPRLRRIVLVYGIIATAIGLVLLTTLPITLLWRALANVAWLLVNVRQLLVIAKGYKCCQRIRIEHDGSVTLQAADGCWFPATLIPGSVVLPKVAWLRFRAEDGQQFAELICEKSTRNKDWRRLQVIWRHIGAGR
jgi:hypothetical protein